MSLGAHVVPGTVLLGKYRVERVLGAGGMGMVVAATHLQLQEQVALKFLLPEVLGNHEVVRRFLREAQAAVRLKGEHVARVIDVGTLPEGTPYIVMEYLQGSDLAGHIAQRGALPPGEIVDHVLQACEALAEAHALGIVHRDIKPANLFLTRRPDGSTLVKVLDFGISKAPVAAEHELTRTQAVMGTPAYMSPEQMRSSRDVDRRSDIWSLGVILYECLSGRRPFEAEAFSALCLQVAMDPIPPLHAAVPRGLDAIVSRCLEKDPRARYDSVADLAQALAPYAATARAAAMVVERTHAMRSGVAAGTASAASPTEPTTLGGSAIARTAGVRGARWAIGGALLAFAVVGVILTVLFEEPQPDTEPALPAAAPVVTAADAAVAVDAAIDATRTVTLQFLIEPRDAIATAIIVVDGKRLDDDLLEVAQSHTTRVDVQVTAPGYQPYQSAVLPTSDLAVTVVLIPAPAHHHHHHHDARPARSDEP